jgi:signal transduction histidine kinase
VLGNLISNGIKFSPRGDEVLLSAVPNGTTVRVSVTDHGAGIPDAFKPHIFQKFSQADASTVRQHKGMGLGLHISKLIIERHGGKISFQPASGGGTVFYFDLPASTAAAELRPLAAE